MPRCHDACAALGAAFVPPHGIRQGRDQPCTRMSTADCKKRSRVKDRSRSTGGGRGRRRHEPAPSGERRRTPRASPAPARTHQAALEQAGIHARYGPDRAIKRPRRSTSQLSGADVRMDVGDRPGLAMATVPATHSAGALDRRVGRPSEGDPGRSLGLRGDVGETASPPTASPPGTRARSVTRAARASTGGGPPRARDLRPSPRRGTQDLIHTRSGPIGRKPAANAWSRSSPDSYPTRARAG